VSGVLKGCATPGFDVAAGAPVGERGVAVVEVSAVMGVERREGVVVKARARAGVRRERQRVQIMVVRFGVCCEVCWVGCSGANGWLAPMEVRDVESPKAEGRSEESVRRPGWNGVWARDESHFATLPYRLYTTL